MCEKACNDASLSKLGDMYQYYRALLDCFRLGQDDMLTIEVQGDVSTISHQREKNIQKEIKHHIGDSQLTDRHIDFWKTVKNWIVDKKNSDLFFKLELYTTASIPKECKFYNWNTISKESKYNIMKEIGKKKKTREKTFRELYDQIFSADIETNNILAVLDKISIMSKEKQIQELQPEFDSYISAYIPQENRKAYIDSMLGLILGKISEPPHKWIITKDGFDRLSRDCVSSYVKSSKVPLPLSFLNSEPSKEIIDRYREKHFVEEIKRIDLDGEVPYAINDYWKTTRTIVEYFNDNPTLNTGLNQYRDNLKHDLSGEQRRRKNVLRRENDNNQVISESQNLYYDVINSNAEDFGNIIRNQRFFRCGVIHDIVNEHEFIWYIGGKDEH